ncbi:MAG: hypothetical protein ACJ8CR_24135 [Roseiflexaceae bacterium]
MSIRTAATLARHPTSALLGAIARPRLRPGDWGWLPALSLLGACGVLLVALAHTSARYDVPWAQPLYWLALVVLFTPLATRLIMPGISRQEAIGLVVFLGLAISFVKLLQSPLMFTFFDEFLHWRTANDILRSGHLFKENSLLPVSPLYPGLELATTAVANLTGLSIFGAGVVVGGVARVVVALALYLFYEQVSGSVRVAGIASAIYMGNPHFVIFDAQFAYESLGLAFLLTILLALLRSQRAQGSARVGLNVVAVLCLWSLVATHHATSYTTAVFLILWAGITAMYKRWFGATQPGMIWVAILAIVANVLWLVGVASITIGYLAPHLQGAIVSVLNLIAGEGSDRELFKSNNGIVTPLLEKLVGLGAPGLIMLCLPVGLMSFWRTARKDATAFMLALGALTYPVTLAMRLTGGGWEVSARSSVFVFLPLAFILALGIEHLWLPGPLARLKPLLERVKPPLFALFVAVLFCGGIIAGWSPWARMPWPYTVGADTRSIEPQGLAAAAWASAYLGPDNRIAADRINMTLMGTYGEQRMITNLIDGVSISGIFLAQRLGPNEREALHKGRIHYIVVDRRVSTALPLDGHYYEGWEKMIVPYSGPISPAVLGKFDTMPSVSQVFDSGDIKLYDVGALAHEP